MYISKKEIQLLYADTDMMGVMYHANYLKWFELGRTAYIEDLGFKYTDMEDKKSPDYWKAIVPSHGGIPLE